MEWVKGEWGRLWGRCGLGRRCRCGCCTYRLREWYCGLCTGWSRGGQKGTIGWWIVTVWEWENMHENVFWFKKRQPNSNAPSTLFYIQKRVTVTACVTHVWPGWCINVHIPGHMLSLSATHVTGHLKRQCLFDCKISAFGKHKFFWRDEFRISIWPPPNRDLTEIQSDPKRCRTHSYTLFGLYLQYIHLLTYVFISSLNIL